MCWYYSTANKRLILRQNELFYFQNCHCKRGVCQNSWSFNFSFTPSTEIPNFSFFLPIYTLSPLCLSVSLSIVLSFIMCARVCVSIFTFLTTVFYRHILSSSFFLFLLPSLFTTDIFLFSFQYSFSHHPPCFLFIISRQFFFELSTLPFCLYCCNFFINLSCAGFFYPSSNSFCS